MQAFADQRVYAKCTQGCFSVYKRKRQRRTGTPLRNETIHPKQVHVRKHFGAGERSAVPKLGVTCPQFFRCEAPPGSHLAIFQRQRVPRLHHVRRLPCTAKQILNRLPVVHGENETDSVVTGTEIYIELLVLRDSNVGVEIVPFPLRQWASQIEPFQHSSEFRSSRVSIYRIAWRERARKMQVGGEIVPLFSHQIKAVSALLLRWQSALHWAFKVIVIADRLRS